MSGRARTLGIVLLAFVAACESMPGRPLPEERPVRPDEVESFDVLWSTNCSGCHGADGTLGAARPLNDPLYLDWISDVNLRVIIQQGIRNTAMPAFSLFHGGSLTDAQVEILISGMRSRWGHPEKRQDAGLPPYAAAPGEAARGEAAYARFCSRCHGPDGTGGEAPGSIVDPTYLALVSNQALRSAVVAGRVDLGMPDYRKLEPGAAMTDQQIADVVAWLAGHRVRFPGQPFARKEAREGKDG